MQLNRQTERMDPKCLKHQRFLFFKWEALIHNFELVMVSKFMSSSNTFHAYYKCSECGLEKKEEFTTADELIRQGVPPLELNKIGRFSSSRCYVVPEDKVTYGCRLEKATEDFIECEVTTCCKVGPIVNEKFCSSCGKEIVR